MKEAANRGKGKTLLISAGIEIMLIICIMAANLNPTPILYFIFYNLLYGLVFSLLIPLYCLYKENGAPASGRVLAEAGFKKLGIRQWGVLAAFVVFSVGGQLISKMAVGEQIYWHLLPRGIVPLIMTTFFEEFLFRGFVQSRIDRQFGWVPAILVSGAMFSLYHLGYPGFRTWEDILLLFVVGGGFAAAYKLSGNNLIVSFFANLPNAFVTYMLKYEQFPVMSVSSTIAAAVILVLIGLILLLYHDFVRYGAHGIRS
ncbi:CPBP family intramembrane glutamic endopeptidase [Parablautia muri]|uniref:CPBP family intramembrane metalloprotease n=1 Tax=Parablautia muri TaxID=2320879 RepID=A0A9X5GTT5_9FIRM|nr:type II CAAX endopeptidase family protein [Parablautia muri]NBJ94346.1 CPBP family intramembrane metalloprotease [Parablautia muri]